MYDKWFFVLLLIPIFIIYYVITQYLFPKSRPHKENSISTPNGRALNMLAASLACTANLNCNVLKDRLKIIEEYKKRIWIKENYLPDYKTDFEKYWIYVLENMDEQ